MTKKFDSFEEAFKAGREFEKKRILALVIPLIETAIALLKSNKVEDTHPEKITDDIKSPPLKRKEEYFRKVSRKNYWNPNYEEYPFDKKGGWTH